VTWHKNKENTKGRGINKDKIIMKINKETIGWVLRYINCRNNGQINEAKEARDWLKKNLKKEFESILKMHGDPDLPEQFEIVRSKWEAEL